MAKDHDEDSMDIFEKVLLPAAVYGVAGRASGKLVRRINGIKKPSRAKARKNEEARWERREADKIDNALTAYGVAHGGLVGALGPDPRINRGGKIRSNKNRK